MNKKIPQIKQIENHLLVHGKITSWKAITSYGITRLSAHIHTLREKNWIIDNNIKTNKYSWWVEYQLKNYPNS